MERAPGHPSSWLTPPRAIRLALLVIAAAVVAVGLIGLLLTAPPGAIAASDLAAASDGEVHVTGTILRTWTDLTPGSSPTTHIVLHGAEDVDIRVAGTATSNVPPGGFVEIRGTKSGLTVDAASVTLTQDPVDRAAPWLALGAVILTGQGATTLASFIQSRAGQRDGRPALLGRLRGFLRRRGRDEEDGPAPPMAP